MFVYEKNNDLIELNNHKFGWTLYFKDYKDRDGYINVTKEDILIICGKLISAVDDNETNVLNIMFNNQVDKLCEKLQELKK